MEQILNFLIYLLKINFTYYHCFKDFQVIYQLKVKIHVKFFSLKLRFQYHDKEKANNFLIQNK